MAAGDIYVSPGMMPTHMPDDKFITRKRHRFMKYMKVRSRKENDVTLVPGSIDLML